MTFKQASNEIETQMNQDRKGLWGSIVSETTPGNYGTEDVEFSAEFIEVNFQDLTYKFDNASLSFFARLGSSGDDHVPVNAKFKVSGSGTFIFTGPVGSKKIEVTSFIINEDLDLYPDRPD